MRIKNVLFSLVLLCVSVIAPVAVEAAPLKVGMVTDVASMINLSINRHGKDFKKPKKNWESKLVTRNQSKMQIILQILKLYLMPKMT